MNEEKLEIMRHSFSHVLAAAVKELWPEAKLAIGPAIDNGFYYDIDFGEARVSDENFAVIEKKMRGLIARDLKFERSELPAGEAAAKEKKAGEVYKAELIDDLVREGEKTVSYYAMGKFSDLCRGPHVESTGKLDASAFKLHKLAGAYWRGSEKNKMLTRIYGLAFASKSELDLYLKMLDEAGKRDHKKLGPQLELFAFHETAPGIPYWLPKGMIILNELIDFWRVEHRERGYQEIACPLVNKKELWEISGHWEHYKDDMFIADMGENEVYGIKPMNCPNAMVVFGLKTRSYRDLPLRLSDTDILHRYELSGTLNGLLRVRAFKQDDSHNFITEDQIEEEYAQIFDIANKFYGIFNLEFKYRIGTRPEKFMGDEASWDKAEAALRRILAKTVGEGNYLVAEGDGAFYGPKVDIIMKDVLGRDWQMGTIQLDFQIPRRFNLTYADKDGKDKTPIVVHRVIYGSLERFIGIIIEHYAGAFPLWLSPVQVKIVSVGEVHADHCRGLAREFEVQGIRTEVDDANETVGNKIRKAVDEKVPYMLVIGDKEMNSANLAIRERGSRETREVGKQEFIDDLVKKIKERR
jgi:threonyl-tRNA synthetase